jgi:phage shock protein A
MSSFDIVKDLPSWISWLCGAVLAASAYWKGRRAISADQVATAVADGYREVIEELRKQVEFLSKQVAELRMANAQFHKEVDRLRSQIKDFKDTVS